VIPVIPPGRVPALLLPVFYSLKEHNASSLFISFSHLSRHRRKDTLGDRMSSVCSSSTEHDAEDILTVYPRGSQFAAAAAAAQQFSPDSININCLHWMWYRQLEGQTALFFLCHSHVQTRHVAPGGRHLPCRSRSSRQNLDCAASVVASAIVGGGTGT
jgi:hypothetical protein